jgi:hypothetical protein
VILHGLTKEQAPPDLLQQPHPTGHHYGVARYLPHPHFHREYPDYWRQPCKNSYKSDYQKKARKKFNFFCCWMFVLFVLIDRPHVRLPAVLLTQDQSIAKVSNCNTWLPKNCFQKIFQNRNAPSAIASIHVGTVSCLVYDIIAQPQHADEILVKQSKSAKHPNNFVSYCITKDKDKVSTEDKVLLCCSLLSQAQPRTRTASQSWATNISSTRVFTDTQLSTSKTPSPFKLHKPPPIGSAALPLSPLLHHSGLIFVSSLTHTWLSSVVCIISSNWAPTDL